MPGAVAGRSRGYPLPDLPPERGKEPLSVAPNLGVFLIYHTGFTVSSLEMAKAHLESVPEQVSCRCGELSSTDTERRANAQDDRPPGETGVFAV